jgi:hypothetical protein
MQQERQMIFAVMEKGWCGMSGKARPSLRAKTLENVKRCNLSQTDKDCIIEIFKRYETKVDIVLCKDCIHKVVTEDGEYNPDDIVCDYHMSDGFCENDFCSYGKRKEDEE